MEIVIETTKALRARDLTILLVEQNADVAEVVADQAHVLKDGVVAYSGPARELIGSLGGSVVLPGALTGAHAVDGGHDRIEPSSSGIRIKAA